MHLRTAIRGRVVSVLTGLPTTADRVYPGRTRQLSADHEPSLLVYTMREAVNRESNGRPPILARRLNLFIEARVSQGDPPDDVLDDIAAEVEAAIWQDVNLSGLAIDCRLESSDQQTEAMGKNHVGVLTMEYLVLYRSAEGAAIYEHPTG